MKTFKEYVDECNKLLAENPECGDFPAIYSKDSEGNGYYGVYNSPSLVKAQKDGYYYDIISDKEGECNVVIIN